MSGPQTNPTEDRISSKRCVASALINGKVKRCVKHRDHVGPHSVWLQGRKHYEWDVHEQR